MQQRKRTSKNHHGLILAYILFATAFIYHWSAQQQSLSQTSVTFQQRPLKVLTLFNPSEQEIFHTLSHLVEVELIKAFAKYKNWQIQFSKVNSKKEAFQKLSQGEGDIALSFFSESDKPSQKKVLHTSSMGHFNQILVCHKSALKTKKQNQSLQLLQNHPLSPEVLNSLTRSPYTFQGLRIENSDVAQILRQINKTKGTCTVTNDFIYQQYRSVLLKIRQVKTLDKNKNIVWFLPQNSSGLKRKVESWINDFKNSYSYQQLYTLAENHTDPYENHIFLKRVNHVLPQYIPHFRKAAQKHKIPWKLLAAMAYQESHWNPHAKSFTGVRGLMMLTGSTAQFTGVKDRLNPIESIWGGTKYLSFLMRKIPKEVQGRDRAKFALAAYNVGLGHLLDARKLASRKNLNPNRWQDIRSVLPLLSDKKYAKTLRYGRARGKEPVIYVQKVVRYYQMLQLSSKL